MPAQRQSAVEMGVNIKVAVKKEWELSQGFAALGEPASVISFKRWLMVESRRPGSLAPQSASSATTTKSRLGMITEQLPRCPSDITVSRGASGQVMTSG